MKSEKPGLPPDFWFRAGLFGGGALILVSVYIFQRVNFAGIMGEFSPNINFAINRTLRLIFNDAACLLIIYSVFQKRNYFRLAFLVFLLELFVILPLYLGVKLSTEGASEISSPLLSQIHRLVVNPTLMILLIFGFLYQKLRQGEG